MQETVKLRAGKYRLPATLIYEDGRIYVKFRFSKALIAEIKSMSEAKWHGYDKPVPRKIWSIADNPRNRFQLDYLQGKDPYASYDMEITKGQYDRPCYVHQCAAADFMLSRRQCVLAGEMGVGKTLAVIEVMERSGCENFWYVAPRSGIRAVEREFRIWNFDWKKRTKYAQFEMMTYEGLTKRAKQWTDGDIAPDFIIFDESQKIKNPTSQRSQAALMFANGVRDDWGDKGYVILMSGSPAPKSPADWWHQCEVACPGFLKEGDRGKFERSLGIVVQRESFTGGGLYPHLETWLDDSNKCKICGQFEDDDIHDKDICVIDDIEHHSFEESVDEVSRLYKRMEGLVLVQFKKDHLELPDKIYRTITLEPNQETLQIAKSLVETAPTVIGGITLLRELSDGFQYQEQPDGKEKCPVCSGSGQMVNPVDPDTKCDCDGCGGSGDRTKYKRVVIDVESPKDDALRELLDENADIGRIIVYCGFTGSVDRVVKICNDYGWETIKVDGRGWNCSLDDLDDYLDLFQDKLVDYPRVAFIGHPKAAGVGLTLTAASMVVYYSNSFDAEDRIQSEDRPHRPGMDLNRGVTIVDLMHLPTDEMILANLQKKRRLQSLTLGEVAEALS